MCLGVALGVDRSQEKLEVNWQENIEQFFKREGIEGLNGGNSGANEMKKLNFEGRDLVADW